MKPQTTPPNTLSSENERADATFYLVSRLLLDTLSNNDNRITVKAASGNFFHDPKTSIQAKGPVRVLITGAEIAESGRRTEITMSGVVENQGTIPCSYTFYFLMKRDVAVIPRKTTQVESVIGRSLVIHYKRSSMSLHDSLFNLTLSYVNAHGEDCIWGNGRGFLVFGMKEPLTDK